MRRHELVYLHTNTKPFILAPTSSLPTVTYHLEKWQQNKLPFIYTRQLGLTTGHTYLGVVFNIGNQMQRVAICVKDNEIDYTASLPTVDNFFNLSPQNEYRLSNKHIQVYGSYLYEYLSHNPYTHHASDLDLLISYHDFSINHLLAFIHHVENTLHITVDGEVRFENIGDIAIKELITHTPTHLLVKTTHDIKMISKTILHEYYPNLFSH